MSPVQESRRKRRRTVALRQHPPHEPGRRPGRRRLPGGGVPGPRRRVARPRVGAHCPAGPGGRARTGLPPEPGRPEPAPRPHAHGAAGRPRADHGVLRGGVHGRRAGRRRARLRGGPLSLTRGRRPGPGTLSPRPGPPWTVSSRPRWRPTRSARSGATSSPWSCWTATRRAAWAPRRSTWTSPTASARSRSTFCPSATAASSTSRRTSRPGPSRCARGNWPHGWPPPPRTGLRTVHAPHLHRGRPAGHGGRARRSGAPAHGAGLRRRQTRGRRLQAPPGGPGSASPTTSRSPVWTTSAWPRPSTRS